MTCGDAGMASLGPALQYLAGEMVVEQGSVMPLLASHNTVRMRFDVEQAEYLHLAKPDATFPALHFSMLADQKRCHVSFPALYFSMLADQKRCHVSSKSLWFLVQNWHSAHLNLP